MSISDITHSLTGGGEGRGMEVKVSLDIKVSGNFFFKVSENFKISEKR